jgi:pilus assembly protein CpaB
MKRRIVAVTVAVLLAVLGTVAVYGYVHKADERAVAGQQPVEVYVAKADVPAGTTLKDAVDQDLIERELVAAKGVPGSPLSQVTPTTESLVATTEISPGELVLADRFGTQAVSQTGLAIPTGMMAVSVKLDDPARVGNFLTVGSEIAIFDTFNVQTADHADVTPAGDHIQDFFPKTRATRILLDRVKVIAVGASTSSGGSTSSSSSSGGSGTQTVGLASTSSGNNGVQNQDVLITVAVDQKGAAKLVQGIQTGTLYFALLTDSSQVTAGSGVTDRNLFKN